MTNIELETLNAVKTAARSIINKNEKIDWEQRRYEIAKDILVHIDATDIDSAVEHAVTIADTLIAKLRKTV